MMMVGLSQLMTLKILSYLQDMANNGAGEWRASLKSGAHLSNVMLWGVHGELGPSFAK